MWNALAVEETKSILVFLRLSPIRDVLGEEQWLQKKQAVRDLVIREIGGLLTQRDAHCFHGDDLCIMALASNTESSAQLMARTIGTKIITNLFGEDGARDISLAAHIVATEEVLDFSSLGIAYRSSDLDEFSGDREVDMLKAPERPSDHETNGAENEEDQRTARRRARRKELLEMFGEVSPSDVGIEYRPIWDAKDQVVRTFRCVPYFESNLHGKVSGYRTLETMTIKADTVELDIDCLETGLINLKRALDDRRRIDIRFGIHFETIGANRGRSELIKILPALPNLIRTQIGFVIFGVPEGIPEIRLQDLLGFLRPFAGDILLALDLRLINGHKLTNLLAKICGSSLGGVCVMVPRKCDERTFDIICRGVTRINSFGIRIHAMGVTTGEQITVLAALGAVTFDGPVFGGAVRSLPASYHVDASRLERMDRRMRAVG